MYVMQNAFEGFPMGNSGSLSKLVEFVDSKCDVRLNEKEIEQGIKGAAVERGIREGFFRGSEDLGGHGSRGRFDVLE